MSRTHGRKGPLAALLALAALAVAADLTRPECFHRGARASLRPAPETPARGIIRSIQGQERPPRP